MKMKAFKKKKKKRIVLNVLASGYKYKVDFLDPCNVTFPKI